MVASRPVPWNFVWGQHGSVGIFARYGNESTADCVVVGIGFFRNQHAAAVAANTEVAAATFLAVDIIWMFASI
jgi:hypothetical protein